MKAEDQRIAIAVACGWTEVEIYQPPTDFDCDPPFMPKAFPRGIHKAGECWRELPDYSEDLNAMHEAEEWLKANHIKLWVSQYWTNILSVSGCDKDDGMLRAVHATAAQRAEVFLRTIGKWTE